MSLNIEQLAEQALALPANARVDLVDRLIESLEESSFRQLWATEALRRRDEVRSGKVQTVPGDEAMRMAREAASE
jgi:putative addiction module component (TIGR02574 family)